jgi:hypothetical protein
MAAWLHAARLCAQKPSGHSTGFKFKIEKQKAGTMPGHFPKKALSHSRAHVHYDCPRIEFAAVFRLFDRG